MSQLITRLRTRFPGGWWGIRGMILLAVFLPPLLAVTYFYDRTIWSEAAPGKPAQALQLDQCDRQFWNIKLGDSPSDHARSAFLFPFTAFVVPEVAMAVFGIMVFFASLLAVMWHFRLEIVRPKDLPWIFWYPVMGLSLLLGFFLYLSFSYFIKAFVAAELPRLNRAELSGYSEIYKDLPHEQVAGHLRQINQRALHKHFAELANNKRQKLEDDFIGAGDETRKLAALEDFTKGNPAPLYEILTAKLSFVDNNGAFDRFGMLPQQLLDMAQPFYSCRETLPLSVALRDQEGMSVNERIDVEFFLPLVTYERMDKSPANQRSYLFTVLGSNHAAYVFFAWLWFLVIIWLPVLLSFPLIRIARAAWTRRTSG